MARLKTYRERFKNNELPDPQDFKNVEELVNAYDNGFEGAVFDPEEATSSMASQIRLAAIVSPTVASIRLSPLWL